MIVRECKSGCPTRIISITRIRILMYNTYIYMHILATAAAVLIIIPCVSVIAYYYYRYYYDCCILYYIYIVLL